jgi:hypothetical protein
MIKKEVWLSAMTKAMGKGGEQHTGVASVAVPISVAVAVPVASRVFFSITVTVEVSVFFFVKVILDLHVNIHGEVDARAGGGQWSRKEKSVGNTNTTPLGS